MPDIPAEIEELITGLTSEEFNALISRTRPAEDSRDPKVRAALALKEYRSATIAKPQARISAGNPAPSAKAEAVAALRSLGHRVTTEETE